MSLISLVVPCHNEADNIPVFLDRTRAVLEKLAEFNYEIIFVNDGSRDATLDILMRAAGEDRRLRVIDLSRNFGKESALTAGIDNARGEAVIPIDADLQHPPEVIPQLIARWQSGYDVVLAERISRLADHSIQRLFSRAFYRIHNSLSECEIPENVGDFRLMDRRVVDALRLLPERRRFMKGIFAWVGFRTTRVKFDVLQRHAGRSSFQGWQLWNLALEGITSFSTVPLRVWTYIGGAISLATLVYAFWMVVRTLLFGIDVPGYASLFSTVLFLGGIQLVGIGVLGEYTGRIYMEVKQRPTYIVRELYGFPGEESKHR